MPVFPTLQGPDLEQEAEKSTFAVFLEYIETMRHLLFFLMSLCAACTVITSCSRTNDTVLAARQQAWLDLILSTHNSSDEKDVRLLDSINRLAPPTDRHERVLWQLAQAWLTAAQTNRGVNDSLIVPIVDYLERHGTPAEQTEALLLHARSLEWRGEMEQEQQVYSQALQAALESGDPRMEMRCRQLLTSFYLQRTHLKDEGAQTARRFLQLAEACRDTGPKHAEIPLPWLWRTCIWGASTSRPYTKTRSTTARKKAWSISAKPPGWLPWPKTNTWRCRANTNWPCST